MTVPSWQNWRRESSRIAEDQNQLAFGAVRGARIAGDCVPAFFLFRAAICDAQGEEVLWSFRLQAAR